MQANATILPSSSPYLPLILSLSFPFSPLHPYLIIVLSSSPSSSFPKSSLIILPYHPSLIFVSLLFLSSFLSSSFPHPFPPSHYPLPYYPLHRHYHHHHRHHSRYQSDPVTLYCKTMVSYNIQNNTLQTAPYKLMQYKQY